MQKAEPLHGQIQHQPTAKQGGRRGVASQQGVHIAQLEAMMNSSPQVKRMGALSAMMNNSPSLAAQQNKFDSLFGAAQRVAEESPLQQKTEINSGKHLGTVQLLKWAEEETFHGGPEIKAIANVPAPLTDTGITTGRKVFHSTGIRPATGCFSCLKEGTRVIIFKTKEMQQYAVNDATWEFKTAVRETAVEPIKLHGLDPNYGDVAQPQNAAQYNTRGFNYFGADDKIPRLYGNYLAPDPWRILTFTLPVGTLVEVDPEIPDGLRTTALIPPGNITV